MLRILDARTGEPVPAAPARRGLTRIEAHASGLDPTDLRVLLTADLLVRALELGGTPVWTILTAPLRLAELRTAATALAIRPFEDGRDLASGLGEAQAIHVVAGDGGPVPGPGPVASVAPVVWTGAPGPHAGAEGTRPGAASADSDAGRDAVPGVAPGASPAPPRLPLPDLLADPAALRLALLSVPRGETVHLDRAGLDRAAGQLTHWRRAVAAWARRPSRPVPEDVRVRLRAAWEDDLDLPAVLEVLRDVETAPGVPDGARFETYVYADRLLALDLPSDLGTLA
ncbi:hypothetical protein SAMN05216532_1579 [Streptomyces sp. 2231.1]|uniref:hypothetical protein n=1 Tax=Streptomyces sp. 2231.1 TaxID=1855347 RepID=UPI0008968A63|nr:hypothetical protein [Streptomyces sp. 2231.1]SEC50362.1 hypothetical protein SAMN05216532_1579 [Streptomyces sp. 2231.1]